MEYFQIVQNALEMVQKNIQPFIEEALQNVYGNEYWIYMESGAAKGEINQINSQMKDFSYAANKKYKDVLFYLNAMIKNWEIFRGLFPTGYALCLCYNIKHFRNKWAHQSKFTSRELYRFLDECQALLEEIKANTAEIDILRKAVMEVYFNEEVNKALNEMNGLPIIENSVGSGGNSASDGTSHGYGDSGTNCSYTYNNYTFNNNTTSMHLHAHANDDNLTMMDGDEVDKNLLHDHNYKKLVNNKISNSQPVEYNITYYDEEEEVDAGKDTK